jgi:hypothetical protein
LPLLMTIPLLVYLNLFFFVFTAVHLGIYDWGILWGLLVTVPWPFIECQTHAGHHSRNHGHSQQTCKTVILFPFDKWGHWSSAKLSNLPRLQCW